MTARHWTFTLNNPEGLLDFTDYPNVRYAIYQEEIGEEGTNHFQGYIQCTRPIRIGFLQRVIPGGHFEIARGSPEQNIAYCTKPDTRVGETFEYGEPTSQGERADLKALQRSIDEGKTIAAISSLHFREFLKYSRGIEKYMLLKSETIRATTKLFIFFGPPGTGKTVKAYEKAARLGQVWQMAAPNNERSPTVWFDGYYGQPAALLDDYAPWWLSASQFKKMINSITTPVNIKGGMVMFNPKAVFITSNHDPRQWFGSHEWPAIARRVTAYYEFTGYMAYTKHTVLN